MGVGNYSLTSHHMLNKEVLFDPIINAKKEMPIYLTDLEYVYEYTINDTSYIQTTDVHVIDDHPKKAELTLITCDETGEGRFMVNAELVKKTLVDKVDERIMSSFYQKQNLYE